jgi:AcrR family transcriptional regulator
MCPAPTDRRVRRTHELLRGALVTLIKEKGYDRTTVQDILDEADVGRSTFYSHFRDKEDLLVSGFSDIREAMLAEKNAVVDEAQRGVFLQPLLVILEHVERHRHLRKPVAGSGASEVVVRTLRDSAESLLRDHFRLHFPKTTDDLRLEASIQFATGSFMSLLGWWFDHDIDLTASQVHAMFKQLASQGIRRFLTTGERQ